MDWNKYWQSEAGAKRATSNPKSAKIRAFFAAHNFKPTPYQVNEFFQNNSSDYKRPNQPPIPKYRPKLGFHQQIREVPANQVGWQYRNKYR